MSYFIDKNGKEKKVLSVAQVSGNGGSNVEANPSDTATDELKKIKIDGTTYKVVNSVDLNEKLDKNGLSTKISNGYGLKYSNDGDDYELVKYQNGRTIDDDKIVVGSPYANVYVEAYRLYFEDGDVGLHKLEDIIAEIRTKQDEVLVHDHFKNYANNWRDGMISINFSKQADYTRPIRFDLTFKSNTAGVQNVNIKGFILLSSNQDDRWLKAFDESWSYYARAYNILLDGNGYGLGYGGDNSIDVNSGDIFGIDGDQYVIDGDIWYEEAKENISYIEI